VVPNFFCKVPFANSQQINPLIHIFKKNSEYSLGHWGKKIAQNSRNCCWLNGRSCGSTRTVDTAQFCAIPEPNTNAQRMFFSVTSIALICAHTCTRLLHPLVQSVIVSPGTRGGRLTKNLKKKTGPGRMSVAPRAGTGDLSSRS